MTAHTTPIDKVLPLLSKPRQRQSGQWSAHCPAHADNAPSLSVRETPEGAVLLHCFAGCEVTAIVAALGLELHELYPPNPRAYPPDSAQTRAQTKQRLPRLLTAAQALALLRTEAWLVSACAGNLANGMPLSDAERQRLLQSAARVAWLHTEATAP